MIKYYERCDRCNRLVSEYVRKSRRDYEQNTYTERVSYIVFGMIDVNESFPHPDDEISNILCETCSLEFTKMMSTFMGEVKDGEK